MLFFKDIKTFWFLDIFVNLVPFNYSRKENGIFLKKSCLTLKEGTFLTYLVRHDLLDTGIKY